MKTTRSRAVERIASCSAMRGLERVLRDLHVLLRHRLLREPCGLESFRAEGEELGASDLPVAHRPYGRAVDLDLLRDPLTESVVLDEQQDPITGVEHLLDFRPISQPRL